ncbi:hypothetical protein ACIO93_36660 [Streptomyces sp. NPDC087903]|uniref:hypothetical protein n=1 Tax=Streptomyces sp. NPDC087903 TaxID=3365819 RepID=UPI0037F2FAF3
MPGGDRSRARGGRRNGPLAGLSPQGDALAVWLREITADRTLDQLVAEFNTYKRATWGEFRNGHKPIPLKLLRTVVTSLIVEPRRQAVELERGRVLHHAALTAAVTKDRAAGPVSGAGAGLSVRELQSRLEEALRGRIEVQQTLLDNQSTIRVLEATITSLEDRCAQLEAERDRAVRQARSAEAAEQDLDAFGKMLARAEQRLKLAFQDRGSAEVLLADVRRRAESHQRDLQALRTGPPPGPGIEENRGGSEPDGAPDTAPDAHRRPQRWEYELQLWLLVQAPEAPRVTPAVDSASCRTATGSGRWPPASVAYPRGR